MRWQHSVDARQRGPQPCSSTIDSKEAACWRDPSVKAIALSIAAALLSWTSLIYARLHTPRRGMLWLPVKLAAANFALETALVGIAGACVGALTGSRALTAGYATLAVGAGASVVRTWLTPEVFTRTFGSTSVRPNQLQRPWGVKLAKAPEARLQRDVAFWTVPGSSRSLLCDIWLPPAGITPSGVGVVYLHGSAWTVLDKDCATRPLFSRLAAQGHVIMDVAYRLFPETDIPGMVGDARRAVVWLKTHAAEYGIDRRRIVLSGASAGGHIAALAAYTAGDPELTPHDVSTADTSVRGVLGWYTPVDLAACHEHYEIAALAAMMPEQPEWHASPSPIMRRIFGSEADRLALQNAAGSGRLDWIVGGTPQQVPERYAQLSPAARVHAGCPPTLLIQGRDDIIVPTAAAIGLRDKLQALGVTSALLLLPHADHAFDLLATDWAPAARLALWHAERFLAFVADLPEQADSRVPTPAREPAPALR
jgi:acetyl esterase/lipase